MNATSDIARLDELIQRLAKWQFTTELYQGIAGYAVGSAYCLKQALVLGWSKETSAEPLHHVCAALLKGEPAPQRWLAGFYYNSAILRLYAILLSTGINVKGFPGVESDRHNLQHNLREIVTNGFQSTLQEALDCLDRIVILLEARLRRRLGRL
jgi:hypothetical protein